jgi:hypothetical protein
VAKEATVALSILRLHLTSAEAFRHLLLVAPAAVVVQAGHRAKTDLLVRRVMAVTAPEGLTVLAMAATGQLVGPEVQATAVAAGIPDNQAATEPTVV